MKNPNEDFDPKEVPPQIDQEDHRAHPTPSQVHPEARIETSFNSGGLVTRSREKAQKEENQTTSLENRKQPGKKR